MLIDCGRTDRERSKNGGTRPSSDGEKWLYRKDLGRSTESERECDSKLYPGKEPPHGGLHAPNVQTVSFGQRRRTIGFCIRGKG